MTLCLPTCEQQNRQDLAIHPVTAKDVTERIPHYPPDRHNETPAFIHSICMHLHVTTCHNHNILTARVLKDGDPCADGGGGEVTSAN